MEKGLSFVNDSILDSFSFQAASGCIESESMNRCHVMAVENNTVTHLHETRLRGSQLEEDYPVFSKHEIHYSNGGRRDFRSVCWSLVCILLLSQPQNHKRTQVMTCGRKRVKFSCCLQGRGITFDTVLTVKGALE